MSSEWKDLGTEGAIIPQEQDKRLTDEEINERSRAIAKFVTDTFLKEKGAYFVLHYGQVDATGIRKILATNVPNEFLERGQKLPPGLVPEDEPAPIRASVMKIDGRTGRMYPASAQEQANILKGLGLDPSQVQVETPVEEVPFDKSKLN